MGERRLIHLNQKAFDFIEARTPVRDGNTARHSLTRELHNSLEAHSWLIRESIPELSLDTWQALIDTYAASPIFDRPNKRRLRLAMDVMDHFGVLDISHLTQEKAAIVLSLRHLNQIEQFAVSEVLRVYFGVAFARVTERGELNDQLDAVLEMI